MRAYLFSSPQIPDQFLSSGADERVIMIKDVVADVEWVNVVLRLIFERGEWMKERTNTWVKLMQIKHIWFDPSFVFFDKNSSFWRLTKFNFGVQQLCQLMWFVGSLLHVAPLGALEMHAFSERCHENFIYHSQAQSFFMVSGVLLEELVGALAVFVWISLVSAGDATFLRSLGG